MGELQPAGELDEEDVEVAAALKVAEDKVNDVRQLGFCYVMKATIFQAIRRLMIRAAASRATMRVTVTRTTMHKSHRTCPFISTTLSLTALCLTSLPLTFREDTTNLHVAPASNVTASC